MTKVILAHIGAPCDPPIVNGVSFHHTEGTLWLGETDEETAQLLTRVPAFRRYGGKLEVPPAMAVDLPPNPETESSPVAPPEGDTEVGPVEGSFVEPETQQGSGSKASRKKATRS